MEGIHQATIFNNNSKTHNNIIYIFSILVLRLIPYDYTQFEV